MDCQAIGFVAQPFHSRLLAFGSAECFGHAVAFKLNLSLYRPAIVVTLTIKVLDSDYVCPILSADAQKGAFRAIPLANQTVGGPFVGIGNVGCFPICGGGRIWATFIAACNRARKEGQA